ncbi:pilus assembly PilX family protein [Aestuariirhabdus litorea]|uniref:pilus assembly PilX family protein n=1 Tax=Aestuariirhabdus litorea TaxID=2528527 RepID=UPI001A9F744A|nr:PilX N-terminal domain-containing pilus assembly protein [Aestuariirhabdus litorea]
MKKQRGSVLAISLILLLILTMVGIRGMQSTALEERMSGNYQDNNLAFQAAEAALTEAEDWVLSTDFDREVHLRAGCTGNALCFDSGCDGGLCLTGAISSGCSLRTTENHPWVVDPATGNELTDAAAHDGSGNYVNVWEDANLHRTVGTTLSGVSSPAKYIVEFRCFTQKDPEAPAPQPYPNDAAQWSELYRITALGTGGRDTNRAMLQSTVRKD